MNNKGTKRVEEQLLCANCNNKVREDQKFCDNCGNSLNIDAAIYNAEITVEIIEDFLKQSMLLKKEKNIQLEEAIRETLKEYK